MGDSAASVGVRAGGMEVGAATLNLHHHAVTKAVHETEDLPVVSENGKIESCVESPQGAPASSASPSASPPCSQSMTSAVTPDAEAQTVTSSQTSHSRTIKSAESLQGVGGELQGAIKSQDVENLVGQSQAIHSQSIQTDSIGQSHSSTTNGHQPVHVSTSVSGQQSLHSVSQSHTTQNVSQSHSPQTVVQSHAEAGINGQPLSAPNLPNGQLRMEHSSVDENANSISVCTVPQTAPPPGPFLTQEEIEQSVPAVPLESAAAPESTVKLQPDDATEQVQTSELPVVPEPTTALEVPMLEEPDAVQGTAVVPESNAAPEPAMVSEAAAMSESVTEPQQAVVEIPTVTSESKEAVMQELSKPTERIVEETMIDAQESAPSHESLVVVTEETTASEPQPEKGFIHEDTSLSVAPENVPAMVSEPTFETEPLLETVVSGCDPVVEEISQEHIKEQLHEIITEIEQQVLPEQEEEQQQEDGVKHHTWKPKGKYEVPKTVIKYEDVVPISVTDVTFSLRPQPPKPAPPPQPEPPKPEPKPAVETRHEPSSLTNGAVSPIEIPEGIPLLARILPKDHEEGERKISLERLFTPATDSGDLTPKKNPSKKAFGSSSFYRPDHPTIDDQVELAQRISFSLVDENNKMSRGQSMYMKRKKRSMRWIHAGSGEGGEGQEEEHTLKHPPAARQAAPMPVVQQTDTKKPPMKLLMNPKGVQDFHAVQEHYQTLMEQAVPTSPEVGKIVTEVQSPTGKGAELFAKRKKRMDKFIVDETTVQKAHNTSITPTRTQQHQHTPPTTITNDLAFKKSAVEERNRQQHQIMEQFLRSREESLTLVKSPWQATMETGTPDAAFDDKRQRLKSSIYKPVSSEQPELANTVCERADTKLSETASWLEPPKPMPLMEPSLTPEMTATPAAPPSGPVTPAAIYSAEVMVVQRSSLPPTPAPDVPRRSMLSPASDSSNKRNSLSFNMAAKGWGTYANFYSPVTFAT